MILNCEVTPTNINYKSIIYLFYIFSEYYKIFVRILLRRYIVDI